MTVGASSTEHFDKSPVVLTEEIDGTGSSCVLCANKQLTFDKEKVDHSHGSAAAMFKKCAPSILLEDKESMDKLEVLLGGDHGKGAFTFLCVVTVRHKGSREPTVIELQTGQINSAKDSVELLQPLLEDMRVGIMEMNPVEGKTKFLWTITLDWLLEEEMQKKGKHLILSFSWWEICSFCGVGQG